MNGVVYCRVSTREQIEGISLELQQERCEEYARNKGIQVLRIFVEEGESAKFADRPKLLEALEFCRKQRGRVQWFIVFKLDRFSRNTADHYAVTSSLVKQGIRLASVTEPIDNTPVGKFLEAVFAANAQLDNDIKADRTKEYMRRRLREGIWVWKPPLGYLSSKKLGDEKKSRPDVLDPKTFPILQRAWKEYLNGMTTHKEIARLLTQWGLSQATGRKVHPQFIRKLFSNKYYAGILMDPWSKEEIEGRHEPMVSRAEFAQAQMLLAGKSPWIVPHLRRREEFPLRGFVACSACSVPYTASWCRGRHARYAYYHCRGRGCPENGKTVRVHDLHDAFVEKLNGVTPPAECLSALKEVLLDHFQTRMETLTEDKTRATEAIAGIRKEKLALIDMRKRDLLTDAEFLEEKERLNRKLEQSEAAFGAVPEIDAMLGDGIDYALQGIQQFPSIWAGMQVEPRQRFQRLVFPQGIPYRRNEGFGTAPMGLLYSLSGSFPTRNSDCVDPSSLSWNQLLEELSQWESFHKEIIGARSGLGKVRKPAA